MTELALILIGLVIGFGGGFVFSKLMFRNNPNIDKKVSDIIDVTVRK